MALDHEDALQSRPIVALLEPACVMDGGSAAGLDTTVIAIDALVLGDGRISEVIGFLFGSEEFDVGAKRALIAFEGEHIVGLLLDDLAGDVGKGLCPRQYRQRAMTESW